MKALGAFRTKYPGRSYTHGTNTATKGLTFLCYANYQRKILCMVEEKD